MSHVVTIESRLTDAAAITTACQRLNLSPPVQGTARLFSGEAKGLVMQLPGWRYPIVVDTLTGTVKFDNYGGRWGEQKELNRLLQMYAVEKCRLEARRRGHLVTEQVLTDGSVKLQIIEGG